jgi:hypothetical protein
MKASEKHTAFLRLIQSTIVLGLITFLTISCNDINSSGDKAPAHMNVHLTDAPAEYQEVNVDVQGLRIHFTPTFSDTADTTGNGKWIDLPIDPEIINLLELTDTSILLSEAGDLEPGRYKEFRLILGDNNTVVIDSTEHDLKVPSGQQSGFKIKFQTELEAGEEVDVMIDFDAHESVHQAGNSGKYILKPVLKASVTDTASSD